MSADLITALSQPEAYGHRPETVELRQTHISLLFFAGERVYKVKKPVDLGFLDFTTLERRRHFCEEEVRLNRRLAPDVYLGAVPIVAAGDGLRVGGAGEPVEWAVEMVRLPESRMLPELLERGEIDNARMNELARLLARFHAAAATGAGVDEHGSPAAVRGNVEENFEQPRAFAGGGVLTTLSPACTRSSGAGPRASSTSAASSSSAACARGACARGTATCTPATSAAATRASRSTTASSSTAASAAATWPPTWRSWRWTSSPRPARLGRVPAAPLRRARDDEQLPGVAAFYKVYFALVRGKVACAAGRRAGAGLRRGGSSATRRGATFSSPSAARFPRP